MAYQKSAYPSTEELLSGADRLRRALPLKWATDHSTLQKFADRAAAPESLDQMLAALLRRLGATAENAVMDSTGMRPTTCSAYYEMRFGERRKPNVNRSLTILRGLLLSCVVVVNRDPSNNKREA